LGPQASDPDYLQAAVAHVAVPGRQDDAEGRQRPALAGVDPPRKCEQAGRALGDELVASQLDLKRNPASIVGPHDGIDFQVVAVSILKDRRLGGLGLDAPITNDQRFEEEAEKSQVENGASRTRPESGDRWRGIYEATVGSSPRGVGRAHVGGPHAG
jgi:hypothetical protein